MIVVVLSCFTNWLKANEVMPSFTGDSIQTVTTVPIDIIRKANIKLNERLILKEIVMNQEEQINYYKTLDSIQNNKITELYGIINNKSEEIEKIKKDNNKLSKVIIIESISIVITMLALLCK